MSERVCFDTKEWFFETSFPGIRRCKKDGFRIEKEIFKGKSRFQDIFIFESPGFGRMLALDGIIQFSENDEFIYHEIISHVPLLSHENPKRILVVGGGDGGVLREAAKHPLQELYHVEIDREVVALSQKYLPFVSKGVFRDSRLKAYFEDGKKFVRRHKDFFDVIVIDSTDPVGPGKVLFQLDFYRDVSAALTKSGYAIFQLGPFIDFNLIIKGIAKKLLTLFPCVNTIRLPMYSYSCGSEYCFMIASKAGNPSRLSLAALTKRLQGRLGNKIHTLKYYTPEAHLASFVAPKMWQLANG